MTVEDCYQLGYITKPHGLKGEVQVLLDVDYPQEYKTLESVFVQQGQQLVPFFISAISLNGDRAIISFEDTDTLDLAKALIKHKTEKEVLIPLTDELIKEIDKENNRLYMFIPEGLVDVFLED